MKTAEDIESYMIQMGLPHEEARPGVWIVKGHDGIGNLVITISGPLAVFRVKVMEIPKTNREELFRELLELNATEMVHAGYGIEDGKVILTDALQLENLDFNEFQATVDDITLAVADHFERLAKHHKAAAA